MQNSSHEYKVCHKEFCDLISQITFVVSPKIHQQLYTFVTTQKRIDRYPEKINHCDCGIYPSDKAILFLTLQILAEEKFTSLFSYTQENVESVVIERQVYRLI